VQEHIAGIPCSVAFVADGRGAVILGFSEQLIGRHDFGARGFRYCGNIFPLAADLSAFGSVLPDLVTGLTQAFGLVGVGGVDFVLTETGPVVLEVNPRYTGSMELIEHATGMSIFAVGGNLGFAFGPLMAAYCMKNFGLKGSAYFFVPGAAMAGIFLFSRFWRVRRSSVRA